MFGLDWFYAISTVVGYLMPHPVNTYKLGVIIFLNKPELLFCTLLNCFKLYYVLLTIQLSISHFLHTSVC